MATLRSFKQACPTSIYLLLFLLFFLAVRALVGDYLLVRGPSGGKLGNARQPLEGSLFVGYFVPDLILFCVLGVFPLLALWLNPLGH